MFTSKLTKLTMIMIYTGTAMLSVLSFFTSFYGMEILLDTPLALIGSLGLQIALLGIAWSLMKNKDSRGAYLTVFAVAATFSVFFSYANFDSVLKAPTRSANARGDYTVEARPALDAYSSIAKNAALHGHYQLERLNRLVIMEQEKGWSTVSDEGMRDGYVQSVIDGARHTIGSWENLHGAEYSQGAGYGIITDFLESSLNQAQMVVGQIEDYAAATDSAMLALSTGLPVEDQYRLVNNAWVMFPISEIGMLGGDLPALPLPPEMVEFVEQPTSRQEAFMLVIDDLFEMDYLAAFSLALALAIDLIVILMALAGSRFLEGPDFVFDRVKRHSAQQIREVSLDDSETFATALSNNIARYRQAINYRLDLARVLADYEVARKKAAVTLKRGPEEHSPEKLRPKKRWMSRISLPMNIRSRLAGWIDGEGRSKSEASPVGESNESASTEEKKREPVVT